MAAPTPFDVTFPIDVVYTWVDGDDPSWNAARRGARGRRRAQGVGRRTRGSAAATSCATRCAACTSSPRGCATSTSSPPASGRRGWPTTHRITRRRPPRHPPRRRPADLQLAGHRDRAAPDPRPGRALRLRQRRRLPRPPDAPGAVLLPRRRRRGVRRRRDDRPRRLRRQALPARGGQQPGAAPRRVRRRDHPGDGALAAPAAGLGADRDRAALPRLRSPAPLARPSAPRPTCRCCPTSRSTTG